MRPPRAQSRMRPPGWQRVASVRSERRPADRGSGRSTGAAVSEIQECAAGSTRHAERRGAARLRPAPASRRHRGDPRARCGGRGRRAPRGSLRRSHRVASAARRRRDRLVRTAAPGAGRPTADPGRLARPERADLPGFDPSGATREEAAGRGEARRVDPRARRGGRAGAGARRPGRHGSARARVRPAPARRRARDGRARGERGRRAHPHLPARRRPRERGGRLAARDARAHAAAPRRARRGRLRARDRAHDREGDGERAPAHGRGTGPARSALGPGGAPGARDPGVREGDRVLPVAGRELVLLGARRAARRARAVLATADGAARLRRAPRVRRARRHRGVARAARRGARAARAACRRAPAAAPARRGRAAPDREARRIAHARAARP